MAQVQKKLLEEKRGQIRKVDNPRKAKEDNMEEEEEEKEEIAENDDMEEEDKDTPNFEGLSVAGMETKEMQCQN